MPIIPLSSQCREINRTQHVGIIKRHVSLGHSPLLRSMCGAQLAPLQVQEKPCAPPYGSAPASCIAFALGAHNHMAKLYFNYSTMNAGKSTLLLQASHNYKERGM